LPQRASPRGVSEKRDGQRGAEAPAVEGSSLGERERAGPSRRTGGLPREASEPPLAAGRVSTARAPSRKDVPGPRGQSFPPVALRSELADAAGSSFRPRAERRRPASR